MEKGRVLTNRKLANKMQRMISCKGNTACSCITDKSLIINEYDALRTQLNELMEAVGEVIDEIDFNDDKGAYPIPENLVRNLKATWGKIKEGR